MNTKINEVKRQYFYAIQPVKLFETQKENSLQQNLNNLNFISTKNISGNNPFHPDISNTNKGNRLDFIS